MRFQYILIVVAALVSGCATGPTYEAAQNSEFIKANYDAVDKLVSNPLQSIDKKTTILVATTVNIDALNQSSRFGRLISEQIATRLTQSGYTVGEMKLRGSVYIREGAGELMLSRDIKDLSKSYNAQVIVVGSYAVAKEYVYLTLKVVSAADGQAVGAVNYVLPITQNTRELLTPTSI